MGWTGNLRKLCTRNKCTLYFCSFTGLENLAQCSNKRYIHMYRVYDFVVKLGIQSSVTHSIVGTQRLYPTSGTFHATTQHTTQEPKMYKNFMSLQ